MSKTTTTENLVKKMYISKIIKSEKALLKKHNDWKNLTLEEKNKITKENCNVCKIMKNLYYDWENCDISTFVSDAYYQTIIIPKLNPINYGLYGIRHKSSYFSDKNYQEKFVEDVKFPKTVARCINHDYYDANYNYITDSQFLNLLNKHDKLVFKKSLGIGHGKGVKLGVKEEYKEIIQSFGSDFIVQEVLEQHKEMAKFNNSSVNIVRITSLYWKGNVYILGSILRVGAPGAFCDHLGYGKTNPRIVALDENGALVGPAIDPNDGVVYKDIFGKKVTGIIPKYNKMKEIVMRNHSKFAQHKIIGWDFAVDKNENVVCIEYNSTVPGIIQTQMVCGPVFAQQTKNKKSILEEIIKGE